MVFVVLFVCVVCAVEHVFVCFVCDLLCGVVWCGSDCVVCVLLLLVLCVSCACVLYASVCVM